MNESLPVINFNLTHDRFQELEDYASKGSLKLRLAFSRDQPKKLYVTHLLEEDADLIWDIVGEKKGHFYLCG